MIQIHWLYVMAGIAVFGAGFYLGTLRNPIVRIVTVYLSFATAFGVSRLGKVVLNIVFNGQPIAGVQLDFGSDLLDGLVLLSATAIVGWSLWLLRKEQVVNSGDLRFTLVTLALRHLSLTLPSAGAAHRLYLRGRFGLLDQQTAQSVSRCPALDVTIVDQAYMLAVRDYDTVRLGL